VERAGVAPHPVLSAPIGAQTPALHLEKIAPASISLGKPLTYEIVARNTGSVPVFNVRVEDELPGGARFINADPRPEVRGDQLVWTLGSLEAGGERRITVEIQPANEGEFTSAATVSFSAASGMKTRVTRPKLTLTLVGPENVQVGDPAQFQLRVSNEGSGPATNVVLHDILPVGLWHEKGQSIDADLGTLPPGGFKQVSLTATATSAGPQVNEALVTADEGVQATARANIQVTQAVLNLRASGPRRRYLHREAQLELEVSNSGTAPAANVRVEEALPEGLQFVSASEGGVYNPTNCTIAWTIGTLSAGQKQTVSVKVMAKAPGDLVARASAQADRRLQAQAETAIHVEGIGALLLQVVDLDDPIEVGAETTYEIRVLNQGTAPCTNVQIVATVPEGMEAKTVTGPAPYRAQGRQVVFEPMPRLAPRADAVFRVHVVGRQPGDLHFRVQLNADQLRTPVHEEESTHVYDDRDDGSPPGKPEVPKTPGSD
jgi:uncharacterized repeat protein (TIGR01451 family)